ncbi:MAG: hypothetical protein V4642_09850 [Bacteroidota bacterium]
MKKIFFSVIVVVFLSACVQSTKSNDNNYPQAQEQSAKPVILHDLVTLDDAEKILGEPAHLSDSSTKREESALTYHCAYKANAEDTKSKKTGAIYFLFEEYDQVSAAQKKYTFIKTANQNHGIKTLDDVGEEAYFHSDRENFYFIMVRKGNKVFNMKVNKITSTTSLDEFNRIARKITDNL